MEIIKPITMLRMEIIGIYSSSFDGIMTYSATNSPKTKMGHSIKEPVFRANGADNKLPAKKPNRITFQFKSGLFSISNFQTQPSNCGIRLCMLFMNNRIPTIRVIV